MLLIIFIGFIKAQNSIRNDYINGIENITLYFANSNQGDEHINFLDIQLPLIENNISFNDSNQKRNNKISFVSNRMFNKNVIIEEIQIILFASFSSSNISITINEITSKGFQKMIQKNTFNVEKLKGTNEHKLVQKYYFSMTNVKYKITSKSCIGIDILVDNQYELKEIICIGGKYESKVNILISNRNKTNKTFILSMLLNIIILTIFLIN